MREIRYPWYLLGAVLLLSVSLIACSDDDGDSPTDPGGGGDSDTTAPFVVGTDPNDGESDIDLDESVEIVFSEAIDPTTATGQITMTPGTGVTTEWVDDRTLEIDHDPWDEGTEITVTLGTGLADEAGNTLAAPHEFSFFTMSTTALLLLETTPADGATGINRDAPIVLLFSSRPVLGTVSTNVTISDGTRTDYTFDVSELEGGRVLIDPDETLPADTEITVTVAAGIMGQNGLELATPTVFSFTTSADVDTTPPTVTGAVPANGTTDVSPDQGFLRLTFSEPVNPETVQPTRWNLTFLFLMEVIDASPSWNQDGTEMTVPLPSGLPAGLPIVLRFDGITDLAGNAGDSYSYEVKVAGDADYVPMVDGSQWAAQEYWAYGDLGNDTPLDSGSAELFYQYAAQAGDVFHFERYNDAQFTELLGWESFRRTADAWLWLGFEDTDPAKTDFDEPVIAAPLPLAAGTWSDETTVTIPGEGTFRATLSGTVLPQVDVTVDGGEDGEIFISGCWRVVHELAIQFDQDGDWVDAQAQTDTLWLAPTVGQVRRVSESEDLIENTWDHMETWFQPYGLYEQD